METTTHDDVRLAKLTFGEESDEYYTALAQRAEPTTDETETARAIAETTIGKVHLETRQALTHQFAEALAVARIKATPAPAPRSEGEANPDNDEFKCDLCSRIYDNDYSVRVGKDGLICTHCEEREKHIAPTRQLLNIKTQLLESAEKEVEELTAFKESATSLLKQAEYKLDQYARNDSLARGIEEFLLGQENDNDND